MREIKAGEELRVIELKLLREAFDRKTELYDGLNKDYVAVRDENKQLNKAIANIKRICEQSENSDTRYIQRILDELEGEG